VAGTEDSCTALSDEGPDKSMMLMLDASWKAIQLNERVP